MRCEVLTTDESARWRAALPADACVMGSVEYVRICERQTGCGARLFVLETDGAAVAYPLLLRPIRPLPFSAEVPRARFDTFTPEYTGPIATGPALSREACAFFAERFALHCQEEGIIAEFAHLNPWKAVREVLDPPSTRADREIIYMDLTWGEDRLWRESLSSDTRRNTKQAAKAGVQIRHAASSEDVREFHRLYRMTMERRNALDRYLLPVEYFLAFFETMRENSLFALAEYAGRIVAGGLFLHGGADVYWHLSAVDLEFGQVRPVNAVVFETVRWALAQGKRRMLFGGGYAPGDGVFRFKAGFSPLRLPFQTYRRVHDAESYASLNRAWSAYHGEACVEDYFPAYRRCPARR